MGKYRISKHKDEIITQIIKNLTGNEYASNRAD